MSYRIQYRGLDIVVDKPEEIVSLADCLQRRVTATLAVTHPKPATTADVTTPVVSTSHTPANCAQPPRTISDVVASASDEQKRVLQRLLLGGECSDEALREAASASDNKQIAGILGGLAKRLKSAGLDPRLVQKRARFENKRRIYKYWIRRDAVEEVRAGLQKTD